MGIGSRVSIYLIATQNDKIRFLLLEKSGDEVEGTWVGLARTTLVLVRDRIPTMSQACAQVEISQLHNLELAVVPDPRRWLLMRLLVGPASDGDVGRWHVSVCVEHERGPPDPPAGAYFVGVVSEEHIDGGDGILGVARVRPGGSQDPETRGPRFPSRVALFLGAVGGVYGADLDVDDDLVVRRELFLLLPLDVDVCAGRPGVAQVQVLVDAMPDVGVELAGGEYVDFATSLDGDVGDDEAVVVLGHVLVDGIGQESKVAVEEEDDQEGEEGRGGELGDGAHLFSHEGQEVSTRRPALRFAYYMLHVTCLRRDGLGSDRRIRTIRRVMLALALRI